MKWRAISRDEAQAFLDSGGEEWLVPLEGAPGDEVTRLLPEESAVIEAATNTIAKLEAGYTTLELMYDLRNLLRPAVEALEKLEAK